MAIVAWLALVTVLSASCVVPICRDGPPDPEFEGTWTDEAIRLVVGIEVVSRCEDLVRAAGTNESGPWDALTFTGTVVAVGRVRGTVTLWSGGAELATLPDLEIPRAGDVITLRLRYTAPDGLQHDDLFALVKETS